MIATQEHPLLLFDGVCNLCNGSVQWILLHDKRGVFRFASLQSDAGQAVLEHFGLNTAEFDSIVLVQRNQLLTQSDAVLGITASLGLPWSLFGVFRFLPRKWRNGVYAWIARNRYRWFGKRESCMLPRKEWAGRFL